MCLFYHDRGSLCIFHVLQGHLKQVQSASAGVCAAQAFSRALSLPRYAQNPGSSCMFGNSKSAFVL